MSYPGSDSYHETQRDRRLQYAPGCDAVPRREYRHLARQNSGDASMGRAKATLVLGLVLISVIAPAFSI